MSAAQEWADLCINRDTMLTRKRKLAELTVPSAFPEKHYNAETDALTNGPSSLGAQGVTNIVNKLMMAMFAPGISFLKLEIDELEKAKFLQQLGLEDDSLLTDVLANGERSAMKTLEQSGSRPNIYEGLLHLVVVGDVLMDLSSTDRIHFIGLRDYAVRRNSKGKVVRLILTEKTKAKDLEPEAAKEYFSAIPGKPDDDVVIYTVIRWASGMYRSEVWVNEVKLSAKHGGRWTEENMPYRALTWRLPMGQHYGVSLCEDYANDFVSHETISEALHDGAVLASQFRWACNPGGLTDPADVEGSENGAVIPASADDLKLIFANIGQQLATVQASEELWSRRIGRGFLMNTNVIRNAERVTVEEVRLVANELEQSLGGVYSRLSIDMQGPISRWALRRAKIEIKGTKIEPTIITGLDALSRGADLERLMGFLSDLANLTSLDPQIRMRLQEGPIIAAMAAGRGVDRSKFVASDAEYQQRMQTAAEDEAAAAAIQTGVEAGANQMGATQ